MSFPGLLDKWCDGVEDWASEFWALSLWDKMNELRLIGIVVLCALAMVVFGLDIALAQSQTYSQPHSVFESQQFEQLHSTEAEVEMIKQQLAQIEADRQKRRDENDAWRQEMRDRMTRVETVGSVAVLGIGLLNTLGFIRKPKGSKSEES